MNENLNNGDSLVAKRGKKNVLLELVLINGVEYWRPLVSGVDIKPLYMKACQILRNIGIDPNEEPPKMRYEVDVKKGSVHFWPTHDVNLFNLADNKGDDA